MSSSMPPPIVPPVDGDPADDENGPIDSAAADRLASQGEDTTPVEERDGEDATNSADADYEASMGKNPETD